MIKNKTNAVISTISNIQNNANKLILSELKKYNLNALAPSHGNILVTLYKNPKGVMLNTINEAIHKDKSTVTALVNKLEKLGFIEKFKNESDGRSTLVKLTQKGLDTQPIVIDKISSKLIKKAYKDFSAEEKKTLMSLLEKMRKNLEE